MTDLFFSRSAKVFRRRLRFDALLTCTPQRGMLTAMANVNSGLNAQNAAAALPSCCCCRGGGGRGVVSGYVYVSPFFSPFFPSPYFFSPPAALLANTCVHSSSINPVCWGSSTVSLPPPPPPPPPPHPVSQLMLVSVIEHIWERLRSVS